MKIQFVTTLILLASTVFAAETTPTGQTIKPTAGIPAPPGVVCAMSVCPTAPVSKRDTLACPVICPNNCSVIDDICCPGQKKAVCNTNSTASAAPSGSSAVSSVHVTSAVSTSAIPSAVPSAATNASSSAAASSPAPSAGARSGANSQYAAVLSTCVLGALLTLGLNQF